MRALTSWALLLVVVVTGWSFGQPSPEKGSADKAEPSKKSLDDLLGTALAHSPDVQVAQAKVKEAEAELRRVRLTLVQKVIEAKGAIEMHQAVVAQSEASLKRTAEVVARGGASHEELHKTQAQLEAAKAQLAQSQAVLNALTGILPGGLTLGPGGGEGGATATSVAAGPGPAGGGAFGFVGGTATGFPGGGALIGGSGGAIGFAGGMGGEAPVRVPRGRIADRVRLALDTPIKMTPAKDKPLAEVLVPFRAAAKDVPFLFHLGEKAKEVISLSLEGEVPLGAAFQALEDVVPGLRCYVREYGIVVTEEGSSAISDGIPLIDFWRSKASSEKTGR